MGTPSTTPNLEVPKPPAWKKWFWRSFGFGAGFAVVLMCAMWWNFRTPEEKPWNATALTAKYTVLTAQVRDEQLHLEWTYAVRNTTERDYHLPGPAYADLMKSLPENGGLQKLDKATWATDITIPVNQTVNVEFDVPISLASFNIKGQELEPKDKFFEFASKRIKEMNGFVFFDYSSRYQITFPPTPMKSAPSRPNKQ